MRPTLSLRSNVCRSAFVLLMTGMVYAADPATPGLAVPQRAVGADAAVRDPAYKSTVLRGHQSNVSSVAISTDGKTVASGSWDGTVRLWDAQTGRTQLSIESHQSCVGSVALSPDGKFVASACTGGPTGADDDMKSVKVWDCVSGRLLLRLSGHSSYVHVVAFSPDGKLLASGSDDGTAKIWDLAAGKEAFTLVGHDRVVEWVAFRPDGKVLATTDGDTIRLWDVETGKRLATHKPKEPPRCVVAFSPDGKTITTIADYEHVAVYDVLTEKGIDLKEKWIAKGKANFMATAVFSPDGTRIASGDQDGVIRLWDSATGQEVSTFNGHESGVTSIVFSTDGKTLVSGGGDKLVKLWTLVQ